MSVVFPGRVLCYLPASGTLINQILLPDSRISGVAFTGSTEVGRLINQTLSQRQGPIASLIAETGGINAMIVDSSALPEQVVTDVISSAFQSAGQRCSALRVLFLQEDTADHILTMLKGAMQELTIGNPEYLSTDVGPLIHKTAYDDIQLHLKKLSKKGKLLYKTSLTESFKNGFFVAPQLWSLPTLDDLESEIFGPVLSVVQFKNGELPLVVEQLNQKGYGLTLGLHTRNDKIIQYVRTHARVGNLYVNRNMIGAVVGVQPFGGEGLSGTGFKAGGPHYLYKFITERTFTLNTTAAGGNATLLTSL